VETGGGGSSRFIICSFGRKPTCVILHEEETNPV
jgi:hypothetical protein